MRRTGEKRHFGQHCTAHSKLTAGRDFPPGVSPGTCHVCHALGIDQEAHFKVCTSPVPHETKVIPQAGLSLL